jgi:hypothetical protein
MQHTLKRELRLKLLHPSSCLARYGRRNCPAWLDTRRKARDVIYSDSYNRIMSHSPYPRTKPTDHQLTHPYWISIRKLYPPPISNSRLQHPPHAISNTNPIPQYPDHSESQRPLRLHTPHLLPFPFPLPLRHHPIPPFPPHNYDVQSNIIAQFKCQ